MGREQKRNFATVADVVEEAARIHDEAVLRTNECITSANHATDVSQRVAKQVQEFERTLEATRAELTRRLDAQGKMVMALEQRQHVISESVTRAENQVVAFNESAAAAYHKMRDDVPTLGAHHLAVAALIDFRGMSFVRRLRWALFGWPK
jgi:predicted DsbA family dithiol-disulfide isomerase